MKKLKRECICEECGAKYPVWFTDNVLWNMTTGHPNTRIDFLCLNCFAFLAEKQGIKNLTWYLTKK